MAIRFQICVRSPGSMGDGADNDCDGLADEDTCTADFLLGHVGRTCPSSIVLC